MIKYFADLLYGYFILNDKTMNNIPLNSYVIVMLMENPKSNYSWRYTVSDMNFLEFYSKKEFYMNDINIKGRRKCVLWIFKPLCSGSCNIIFKKCKAWENSPSFIDQNQFLMEIK